MSKTTDSATYENVPGDPAFPPCSNRRQSNYIEEAIRRDREFERRDNSLPNPKATRGGVPVQK